VDEQAHGAKPVLDGRVTVVTGAAGGIGRKICRHFADSGASVVALDIDEPGLNRLAEELQETPSPGRHVSLTCDISNESDVERAAVEVEAALGRVDVLVAAAGILRPPGSLPKPLVELTHSEWDRTLGVNLRGVFLANRAFVPMMIRQRAGDVVNVASTSGLHGRAHDSAYCASKFGVMGLSESLAEEVRPYGVRVQVVLPDAVATPIWEQNGPFRPEVALDPDRVAELVHYLVTLPPDTTMVAPVIAPLRTRRRSGGRGTRV
jgi:3-oxoacyl-[acyl-carrier protein] reductase